MSAWPIIVGPRFGTAIHVAGRGCRSKEKAAAHWGDGFLMCFVTFAFGRLL
jgi:hypothetical protein